MKRPYGLGTVEPYRDRFRARAPRDMFGKRAVLGIRDTEEEANRLLEDVALLKAEAGLGAGAAMTMKGFGPRFLDGRECAGVRDMKSERSRWKHHVETAHFAEWPLQNVEKTDVRDWLTWLGKKGTSDVRVKDPKEQAKRVYLRKPRKLGAQTRKHCLNLARMAFAAAIEAGHCTVNPCDGIEAPEVPKPPFDYLNHQEQLAVERCNWRPKRAGDKTALYGEADKLRAMFAWGCGIRQYDQWVMKLTDLRLELDDPDMIILCHKNGPRKPPKRIRVQLFGVALRALKRWLELLPSYCQDNDRGLVWPLPSGAQRQRSKSYGWNALLKAAGVKRRVTWHELRDTCATSLLMGWWGRKWTLREVQAMLVHSSILVTERYAHFDTAALAEAARDTIGHKLVSVPMGGSAKSPKKSLRATLDSNQWPSAPEAYDFQCHWPELGRKMDTLVANSEAAIVAAVTDDPHFARLAIEALQGFLVAVRDDRKAAQAEEAREA